MIKSKNPSNYTTPLIRRHVKSLRRRQTTSPRDMMATPLGKALSGRTKLWLFPFVDLLILARIFTALAYILILRINLILGKVGSSGLPHDF